MRKDFAIFGRSTDLSVDKRDGEVGSEEMPLSVIGVKLAG